jgi:Uma2 family endonuclease
MALDFKRHRFTVREFDEMGRAGIFDEDARVELLNGEIVEMAPIGDRHFLAAVRVEAAFHGAFTGVAVISTQNPVRLGSRSEPLPDVALLRPGIERVPSAEDVLLLVEIADAMADLDRRIKVPLYARAGVREVWLVDLRHDVVEVYQNPTQKGYQSVRVAHRAERIAPGTLPDRPVAVSDLLPEPEAGSPDAAPLQE